MNANTCLLYTSLDDDHVGGYLVGNARHLFRYAAHRRVNEHAGPRSQCERTAETLKLPLCVLDLRTCANVRRMQGTLNLISE